MSTATYDPEEVSVTFGKLSIDGYAEGTFVEATPASDRTSSRAGALGDVVRTVKHDRRQAVTVTLLPSAVANAELAQAEKDHEVRSLVIKDNISGEVLETAHGWVSRRPNTSKGDESANRIWMFQTGAAESNFNPLPAHT